MVMIEDVVIALPTFLHHLLQHSVSSLISINHLSSSKPPLFFISERQVFENTDRNVYSFAYYYFYLKFQSKAECRVYVAVSNVLVATPIIL